MKKVAFLLPIFTTEYSTELLRGVTEYFQNKNIKLIVAKTELPNINKGVFDYQYWNLTNLLRSDDIDAYIIASALYCSEISQSVLEDFLSTLNNKPIISIGIDLNLKNSYSVVTDSSKVYDQIVDHLKNVHNCKKIAFLSANSTNSQEAMNRYDGFIAAIKKHDLKFDEKNLFDGQFTFYKLREDFEKKLSNKESVDFDAIVSANDLMASAAITYLADFGISVPKDIKVVGFDNSDMALISNPKLSTVNHNFYKLGLFVGELANNIIENKTVYKTNNFDLNLLLRQSCGCVETKNAESTYISYDGQKHLDDTKKIANLEKYMQEMQDKNTIITLMDTLCASNTLRQFYFNTHYLVQQADLFDITLNFFDSVQVLEKGNQLVIPEEMEMYLYSGRDEEDKVLKPETKFNPLKTLFPSESMHDEPGVYIIYPVFSAEKYYGYLTARVNTTSFISYNVYLKILVSAIANAYDYTMTLSENKQLENENEKLHSKNTTLNQITRIDQFTGLYNRYGFIEEGQRSLDVMQETGKKGLVFFADMDGLKQINDTYGHDMGDTAIKLQAKALKRVLRSTDVIGHLSGDEFAIVAEGVGVEYIELIRNKIDKVSEEISREENLPFTLSVSIGGVDLAASSSIAHLLTYADKELYKQKKIKHSR